MDDDFEEDGFAIVAPPPPRSAARAKSKRSKAVKATSRAPVGAFASFAAAASASATESSEDDRPLSTLKSSAKQGASGKKVTAATSSKSKPKSVKSKGVKAASVPVAATTKKKAKRKAKPATASRSPTPSPSSSQQVRRPSGGMLSVFELCNTDDETRAGGPHSVSTHGGGTGGGDTENDNDIDSDGNTSTLGSEADAARRSADDDETTSTVDGDNGSDQDEGWSDHNRWYCNICKDGGELLCCDRCPRAFHMSCLGMGETAIPETEWFCKMCSECLDRRRAKLEKKEKARLLREAEKLERDAKKLQLKQMKEELIAKKSVDAIESKAKRVLEMQDRILSRKKIKYKDKEEEKLGKLAEDLAQTVRDAKEKLEKLEKEDAALKKKEETLNRKKKGLDDLPDDSTARSEKPIPQECSFGELPSKYMGSLLAVWDSIASFSDILQLSAISVEQFASALAHDAHTTLLTQIHMCLLELVLEDREDDDYVSDDESAMDERERYRYEVQRAPLTVGVPTLSMLNSLSWPCVLHSLIVAVPRFTAHATPELRAAVDALRSTEYPRLSVAHKLALLHFLVRRAFSTEKIRQMLGKHLDASIQASKEFSRAVLQDKKVALEDEKRLREKQRAELAGLIEKPKPSSVKTWLKGDKKSGDAGGGGGDEHDDDDAQSESGGAPGSTSDSELDDLAYSEEALAKNEEELERLQVEERISRHEYLSRKKSLETQRERLRKRAEKKLRKQRQQEQMERKRTAAKKAIQEGLMAKDAAVLHAAIEKGKECNLPERIIVSATHVLEILEAEAMREEEASSRKRKFNEMIRNSFVRTEPLGRDRHQCRYWVLRGDQQRLYIEKPSSSESLKLRYDAPTTAATSSSEDSSSSAVWYYYNSEAEVVALIDSLDTRIPREAQLKTALVENFDVITAEMPMSKPGLLISDLLNEDSVGGRKRQRKSGSGSNGTGGSAASHASAAATTDFLLWQNDRKTWRKPPHARVDVDAFCADLMDVEVWLSKRLRDVGSNWHDRTPGGHADWVKSVKAAASVQDCVAPLLALEAEVMAFELKTQGLAPAQPNGVQDSANKSGGSAAGESARGGGDNDKSDDEDDEDDDLDALADDGSILWPSALCRMRWIDEVKRARTIATLAVALASFEQRLDVFGLAETPNEEEGVSTRRAKSEKEKRSRKERAAKKQRSSEDDAEEIAVRDSNDEWDEDCYICSEGGELLCCDGCPRVFHYTCAGLRRIPRGKTFCHVCDPSVKPVFPVSKSGTRSNSSSAAEARKDAASQQPGGGTSEAQANGASNSSNSSSSADDHIHTASGGHLQTTTKSSEDQWDVDCSVCALGGELLCCDGCPRAFHVACIGMDSIPDDEWFCDECNLQTCAACKKNKIRLDSHVICGSEDGTRGCEGVFHLKCARLSAVPEDDWFCKKCRATLAK